MSNSVSKEASVMSSGEGSGSEIRLEIVEISHLAIRSGKQAREEIHRWFNDVAKRPGSIVVPTDHA